MENYNRMNVSTLKNLAREREVQEDTLGLENLSYFKDWERLETKY